VCSTVYVLRKLLFVKFGYVAVSCSILLTIFAPRDDESLLSCFASFSLPFLLVLFVYNSQYIIK